MKKIVTTAIAALAIASANIQAAEQIASSESNSLTEVQYALLLQVEKPQLSVTEDVRNQANSNVVEAGLALANSDLYALYTPVETAISAESRGE